MIKKRLISYILAATFLLAGCQGNPVQDTVKQATQNVAADKAADNKFRLRENDGTEIVLDKVPERVVVNSLGTALVMDALGIKLAGMTTTTREIPESLKEVPTIGNPSKPNIEKITSLNTDLLIVSSTFKQAQKETFKQNNIRTYFIENQMYADTYKSVEMLGKAFGKEEKAKELLKHIKDRETKALALANGKKAPRVLIIFGTSQSFQIAREASYVGDMVKMLKGVNVAEKVKLGDDKGSYIPFSTENIVESNPEVILRVSHGNYAEIKKLYDKEFETNPIWKSIDAVKNNRVYDLEEELFHANPGLKTIDALEKLAKILYP